MGYELGLYPASSFLLANSYCDIPTLAYGTPLCVGSQWPYYASFMNWTDIPVFAMRN
jgi:hypothetical protein